MVGFCAHTALLIGALLAFSTPKTCNAEIRKFNGMIEAASTFVHFSEGYLVAPGKVDLSGLEFAAIGKASKGNKPVHASSANEGAEHGSEDARTDDDTNGDSPTKPKGGGNRLLANIASTVSCVTSPYLLHSWFTLRVPACSLTLLSFTW